jgi:phosphotransferase system HPr-like phosphotransfer protein
MIFETIGGIILKKVVEMPVGAVVASAKAVLIDERALAFARESLRAKYEAMVAPASYDHVTENLALTADDFRTYFKSTPTPSQSSLRDHLRARLDRRAKKWIQNRPRDDQMDGLVDDFLDAYETYFVATDPHLTTLSLKGLAHDVHAVVLEIRAAIAAETKQKAAAASADIARNVAALLAAANVPFEPVEQSANHIDAVVTDPSSVFPSRFYLFATSKAVELSTIDDIVERARARGRYSHIMLVTDGDPSFEVVTYAERRGIVCNTTGALRDALSRIATAERYVVGSNASAALVDAYHLRGVFIEPDAVAVEPGDEMEDEHLKSRAPALEIVRGFIKNNDQRILFVFGSYGSGKSSLCAKLTEELSMADEGVNMTPVYVALRHLKSGEDLVRVVNKADQLAKLTGHSRTRSLIILDGLDELPDALHADERRLNLLRLLRAAARADKLIVSARTSYFRGMEDFWGLFARSHNHPLWNEMAQFIAEDNIRPKVGAMILREFDSRQVEAYLGRVASSRQGENARQPTTLADIDAADPSGNFRLLARNPLYLFLLANTRPWDRENVGCTAEVLVIFIKYWLTRDIEKGKSRWAMQQEDRLQFSDAVACWMFENGRLTMSFQEFDSLVSEHFGAHIKGAELATLALDLRTTGMFSIAGRALSFICSGFMDYFVAMRFLRATDADRLPSRLPNVAQIQLLAGVVELDSIDLKFDIDRFLKSKGVEVRAEHYGRLEMPPDRILYGSHRSKRWLNIDPPDDKGEASVLGKFRFRLLANVVIRLAREEEIKWPTLSVINSLGLHARASARVVKLYAQWEAAQGGLPPPQVYFARTNASRRPAYLGNFIEVMLLAAGRGSELCVTFEHCTRDAVEGLLRQLGCRVHPESGPNHWTACFDWYEAKELGTDGRAATLLHVRV